MDYYLLSEQDIDEIFVDIENLIYEIKNKIESKTIDEDNEINKDDINTNL